MKNVAPTALWIVALGWVGFALFIAAVQFQDPLWLDELYSAALSAPPANEMLALLGEDVHPPLYAILIFAFRSIFAIDAPQTMQWVNLLGLIAIAFALARVHRHLGNGATAISIVCLVGSEYFILYSTELRSYFLLLCLTYWLACLTIIAPDPASDRTARRVAVILSLLHFFGTAIACAVLVVQAALAWHAGNTARAWFLARGLALIVLIFVLWYIHASSEYSRLLVDGFWIETELKTYTESAWWLVMPLALSVAFATMLVWQGRARVSALVPFIAPVVLLVAVVTLIGLATPITTTRNLIVLAPFVMLAPPLLWAALGAPNWTVWVVLAASVMTVGNKDWNRLQTQNSDDVVHTVHHADCAGRPVVAPAPWLVFQHMHSAYGLSARPHGTVEDVVSAVRSGSFAPCDVVAYELLAGNGPDAMIAAFDALSISITARPAPGKPHYFSDAFYGVTYHLDLFAADPADN